MVGRWTFLSNHADVLCSIARDPGIRLREIAAMVGITERAAHRIVDELVHDGYLTRMRDGRRNRYEIHPDHRLRDALHLDHEVGELLDLLEPGWRAATA
jgi:DNA-binding MarR family transcriptional regulator